MPFGYTGQILRVNLSTGKISKEILDEKLIERFIGGYGIGAKILYDEVPPWAGAFDPSNRLIFATGPVTGTTGPVAGRHTVITKSPLTGFYGDANSGGFWGAELKFSGYDFLIITGRPQKPKYLWINDGETEIRDAVQYWGMNARETDDALRKDLGEPDAKVACIGQAGENMVRYAAIMNDWAERAAARCGVGAVMGYMKLKAIAVRGHKKIQIANHEALRERASEITKFVRTDPVQTYYTKSGTPGGFAVSWEFGNVPAKNWAATEYGGPGDPSVEKIAYPGGYEKVLVGNKACFICPIACRRVVEVKEGKYATGKVEGPEYESMGAFGPMCGIDDINAITKANDLCNLYGLDTLSAGGTIAFAMECYEKGIISKEDTGMDLSFGNTDSMLEMIQNIAYRKGFGDILAEGSRRAARIIGQGSEEFTVEVKGVELPMNDPRFFQGGGPHYACAITGGRHTEGTTLTLELGALYKKSGIPELGYDKNLERDTTEGKGKAAKVLEDWTMILHAMGFCWFARERYISYNNTLRVFEAVTGKKMSIADALIAGERIFNMRKAFNVKHGASRKDDYIPSRLLKVKNKSGNVVRLEKSLPEYYHERGWDPKTSKPSFEKLQSLDLEDIAEDICN